MVSPDICDMCLTHEFSEGEEYYMHDNDMCICGGCAEADGKEYNRLELKICDIEGRRFGGEVTITQALERVKYLEDKFSHISGSRDLCGEAIGKYEQWLAEGHE